MPTLDDINIGMTLDEILGSDAPAEVFGALKDRTIHRFAESLDERAPGGISELLQQLLAAAPADQQRYADALMSEITKHTSGIDDVIDADLSTQAYLQAQREVIDLTTVILPDQVLQPELLDIVTTDEFKETVAAYGEQANAELDDEEDEDEE
jgi:hypothetical protein